MSTATDSAYFPALDQCLAGNTTLVSWRTAYRALCDEDFARENAHLQAFFSDDEAITLLSTALDPFSAPATRTATAFDTKTAPINVAQSSNADYKLDEIKDDAKWLSAELQIEELAALRMAIVEWQERPADQLLNTAYNGLSGLSGPASTALSRSTMDPSASTSGTARPPLAYADQEVRRQRLLSVYLSEKNHILRLSADLLSRCAVSKSDVQSEQTGAFRRGPTRSWIDQVAENVAGAMCPKTSKADCDAFITKCIEKVRAVLERGDASTAWPRVFIDESKAGIYVEALSWELTHTLRLLLAALYQLDGITSADAMLGWFTLMEQHFFLQEGKKLLPPNLDIPQLLISIVSVEIMKVQLSVAEIMQAAGVDLSVLAPGHYINDEANLSALNLIFYRTGLRGISIAAPAVLAWSIITSVIRDMALIHRDVRESRSEYGSDDNTSGLARRSGQRRGSSKDGMSVFEQLLVRLQSPELEGEHRDDPARYLLLTSVDQARVFALIALLSSAVSATYSSWAEFGTAAICKEALLDLMREALPLVQYDTEVLDAVLSILTPVEHSPSSKHQAAVLADKLLTDYDTLRPAVLGEAIARFPYELSPLLNLGTILARAETRYRREQSLPEIAEVLLDLQTFTQEVPPRFRSYELTDEVNDSNTMRLTEALPIIVRNNGTSFVNGQHLLTVGEGVDVDISEHLIPAETSGTIVKEQKPMVLMLNHPYSALGYLCTLLYTFTKGSELSPIATRAALDRSSAAEIIVLFTALLSACLDHPDGAVAAQDLLVKFGDVLGDSHDVVSIIADIFEAELLAHLEQAAQEGSLEIVAAGAEFLNVIIKISPERVWSILAKSSLLGLGNGAMSLVAVVNGTEVQIGQYHFLQACVEMQSLLIKDAIAGLAKRNARPTDVVKATRFSLAIARDSPDTTPVRTMSVVLGAYQKILLDAFQSFPDWKWNSPEQRCYLTLGLLNSFSELLRSTYGIDVAKDPSKRLTSVLAPAAESLISMCAPKEGSNTLAGTISKMIQEGPLVADDQVLTHTRQLLIEQILAIFTFLISVLRIAREDHDLLNAAAFPDGRATAQKRSHNLAATLLQSIPTLASLLASDHAFKAELFTVLEELVRSVGTGDQDPPSILAQFDTEAAHAFLQIVTQLDRPLCDVQVERRAWDFLATIMDSKQQWFAIYLLTGKLPKSRAHRRHDDEIKARSMLAYVLTELASITDLPPQRAVGMLKFTAIAQQTWIWATNEVRSHADFLTNTLAWLGSLQPPPRNPTPDAAITSAREHEMAAYLCDILAINVHASLEIGDKTVLRALVSKLGFLRDHGPSVNVWNKSLHKSLESNLKRAFPLSDLSDFKRTSVHPAPYGREFVYDSDIAAIIFQHNRSWAGATAAQGFAEEFGRANANLSLLHAQMKLLKSWKTLATTLCDSAEQEAPLQAELARIATQCLAANSDPQLDQPGVADAMQIRMELSFVLISKLVGLKNQDAAMKEFLPTVWTLVGTSAVDYEVATTIEDVRYYRQLLQVLYLALQPHTYIEKASAGTEMQFLEPHTASMLVSILGKVIAPGFRALCGNLHTDIDLALPADFALLTALLQGMLAIPGINSVQTLLSEVVASSNIIRGALSLFSWADQLVDEDTQDPIYGEIAIMFLLALSTVRPIAEQMAVEGVLAQLASANLSNYLRKPRGKGPFDEPLRMFVIWAEGFLPLCLNLLDAVGPAIAAEISSFLNSFPEQLDRAAKSLINETPTSSNPRAGAVTLGLVAEAHSLSMISLILNSDMARGASEGINAADIPELNYDRSAVKALVEALTRSKRSLADRIRPATPLEERWGNTAVTGSASNLLAQKVEREMHAILAYFESEGSIAS